MSQSEICRMYIDIITFQDHIVVSLKYVHGCKKDLRLKNFVILDDDKWVELMEPFVVCTEDITSKVYTGNFVQKAIDIINGKNIWLNLRLCSTEKR